MVTDADQTSGRRVYDWWSRHPRALAFLYAVAFLGREDSFRRRALEALELEPGDRVLELGCGNGNGLDAIRAQVGPDGAVLGLDVSTGMASAARTRIAAAGWTNVQVLRGDARRPPVCEGAVDAAYAAMALSAVSDPQRAIEATETALRPGGRFVVLDARPFDRFPLTLANSVVVPVAERLTNWVPEVDLLDALRGSFGTVEVTSFNAGSIVIACARKDD